MVIIEYNANSVRLNLSTGTELGKISSNVLDMGCINFFLCNCLTYASLQIFYGCLIMKVSEWKYFITSSLISSNVLYITRCAVQCTD